MIKIFFLGISFVSVVCCADFIKPKNNQHFVADEIEDAIDISQTIDLSNLTKKEDQILSNNAAIDFTIFSNVKVGPMQYTNDHQLELFEINKEGTVDDPKLITLAAKSPKDNIEVTPPPTFIVVYKDKQAKEFRYGPISRNAIKKAIEEFPEREQVLNNIISKKEVRKFIYKELPKGITKLDPRDFIKDAPSFVEKSKWKKFNVKYDDVEDFQILINPNEEFAIVWFKLSGTNFKTYIIPQAITKKKNIPFL